MRLLNMRLWVSSKERPTMLCPPLLWNDFSIFTRPSRVSGLKMFPLVCMLLVWIARLVFLSSRVTSLYSDRRCSSTARAPYISDSSLLDESTPRIPRWYCCPATNLRVFSRAIVAVRISSSATFFLFSNSRISRL